MYFEETLLKSLSVAFEGFLCFTIRFILRGNVSAPASDATVKGSNSSLPTPLSGLYVVTSKSGFMSGPLEARIYQLFQFICFPLSVGEAGTNTSKRLPSVLSKNLMHNHDDILHVPVRQFGGQRQRQGTVGIIGCVGEILGPVSEGLSVVPV